MNQFTISRIRKERQELVPLNMTWPRLMTVLSGTVAVPMRYYASVGLQGGMSGPHNEMRIVGISFGEGEWPLLANV
jgi:hypothetical protein